METIIVILIVGAAVLYCARHFRNKFKGQRNCNCENSCESGWLNCDKFKEQDIFH